MCVQIYHTTNSSHTYALEVCRHEGAELISLDNDLKMNTLSSYLLLQCMHYTILYISLNKFLNFINFHWKLALRWISFPLTCFFNVCFVQCCKNKSYDNISQKKFLNIVSFILLNDKRIPFFCLVGTAVAVSVGLDNSSGGWKWVNGQPLAIDHLNVTNKINNFDKNTNPCDSNYCGIFYVGSSNNLQMRDNCCNNIKPYFVCSIPFKK